MAFVYWSFWHLFFAPCLTPAAVWFYLVSEALFDDYSCCAQTGGAKRATRQSKQQQHPFNTGKGYMRAHVRLVASCSNMKKG